jgi:flagellar motor switch protein FliG
MQYDTNKRTGYLTLLLVLALAIGLQGQEFGIPSQASAQLESYSRKLTRYYEVQASQAIEKYYDNQSFLVDATVRLEIPENAEAGQVLDNIDALPGLPTLPEELKKNPLPEKGDKSYKVQQVEVDVLIDTSYQREDINFISRLVKTAVSLNEYRGDRVIIRKGVFPSQRKRLNTPEEQVIPVEDSLKEEKASENPFKAYLDHLPSLLSLFIVCLFVLITVWIITRAIVAATRKDKDPGYNNILRELGDLKKKEDNVPVTSDEEDVKQESKVHEELRAFAISAFVGNAETSSVVLQKWYHGTEEAGKENVATLLKCLDPRLINMIGKEFSDQEKQYLEEDMEHLGDVPQEVSETLLKKFRADVQTEAKVIVNEAEFSDLFGFLKQMNETQILHLIKDEADGIVSIVFAQLSPEIASRLLQKMENGKRAKVLARMGQIDNTPLNVYKEIAETLSAKALDVVNMKYVAANGVECVLELLENLPITVQDEYLQSLTQTDLELADKVKSYFVTLSDVPNLPDDVLRNAVRGIPQETLIHVMLEADTNLKERVMSLLPERMQRLVESGLEAAVNVSPEDIERAQQSFLRKAREELKTTGGKRV